jgi:hypothetical protein
MQPDAVLPSLMREICEYALHRKPNWWDNLKKSLVFLCE